MVFLQCNLLNVSFSLPFFKFEKPSPLNSTDISDINHLQQGLVYHQCEWMAGFQRDEHCLDQNGALREKKRRPNEHICSYRAHCVQLFSRCSSLEIWAKKNQIFLPYILLFLPFFRLIIICSLPFSQSLCLGRIN